MGRVLNYEIGKLNIGRRVKLYGRQNGHGVPATLKAAEPKVAVVHPDGHDRDERVEWDLVLDWTSHNPTQLKMPEVRKLAEKIVAPAAPAPPTPPPKPFTPQSQTDTFAVYASLGPELDRAVADVRTAEDLVDEAIVNLETAKLQHVEAVERMRKLRAQAARALSAVDDVLAGTSASAARGVSPS